MTDIPRRCRIDLSSPAENAIREAVRVVEEAGADPLLTEAVNLLGQAQNKVADYVDRDDPTQAEFIGYPRQADPSQEEVGARYGIPFEAGHDRVTPCEAWFTNLDTAKGLARLAKAEVWDLVTGTRVQ